MEGARIYCEIPIFGGLAINETMVNTWGVMIFIIAMSVYLTNRLEKVPKGKQVVVELLVMAFYNLVEQTMGRGKEKFAPYIGSIFMLSLFCSLSSLLTFKPATSDLNTTAAWALLTFVLIQYSGIKTNGIGKRLKGLAEPTPLLLPINILGEISTPVSMAFRHFGNIFAGTLISMLLMQALAAITSFAPALPPIFQIGIPAILSIYFDLFTSGLQAFIFCMLTMVFVQMAE